MSSHVVTNAGWSRGWPRLQRTSGPSLDHTRPFCKENDCTPLRRTRLPCIKGLLQGLHLNHCSIERTSVRAGCRHRRLKDLYGSGSSATRLTRGKAAGAGAQADVNPINGWCEVNDCRLREILQQCKTFVIFGPIIDLDQQKLRRLGLSRQITALASSNCPFGRYCCVHAQMRDNGSLGRLS